VLGSGLRPAVRRLALLAALIALPLALGLVRGAQPAAAIVSCAGTFTTAGETPCQIPANAKTITITATGATGGLGAYLTGTPGNGDQVQATFNLPLNSQGPGGTLYVEVGGRGGEGGNLSGGTCGANGGAKGGDAQFGAGGGGGASDVRTCSAMTNCNDTRQAVAGGGGGNGTGNGTGGPDFSSGSGGNAGLAGMAGTSGEHCTTAAQGGQSVSGGFVGGAGASGDSNCNGGGHGDNGLLFTGGPGGGSSYGGAGGGGGGLSGGGGGGGAGFDFTNNGGGGGSDFVSSAATSQTTTPGVGTGSGSVAITFTFLAASSIMLSSAPSPSTTGQSVTFTATVTCTDFTPTGTVTFTIDGTPGSPQPLSGAPAKATFSTSTLAAGGHPATAAYDGDSNCANSTSTGITQTVNAALQGLCSLHRRLPQCLASPSPSRQRSPAPESHQPEP
jgi:Bacterial Ig-like domain (group 3)